MRTIEELRKANDGKLYIYCCDQNTEKKFLIDAENEGYRFGDIKPTDSHQSDIIAIEDNKKVAHVGTIGRMAFQTGEVIRIDYKKYIDGESDYFYHK